MYTHAKTHHCTILATLALIFSSAAALPEPTYTIHYVRSYRRDLVEANFGCGKSVVYGTYLYPLGTVDALYALTNSYIYGFNAGCQRKDTYAKIFGQAQDYQELQKLGPQVAEHVGGALNRAGTRKLVIEWKYLPEASMREEAFKTLVTLATGLQNKGFTLFLKAPASYFCLQVAGKKYLLDVPIENMIVELYGEEPAKYTTYDSIFGTPTQVAAEEGYSAECPKFPTRSQLAAYQKKIYFEKTMDPSLPGYIGSVWEQFLEKAGVGADFLYFYDGYPLQTVDL